MRSSQTYTRLFYYLLLLLAMSPVYTQVGPVGIRDSFSIDPSKLMQDEIPKFERKEMEELRKSNKQISEEDDIELMPVSKETGNTKSSQFQNSKILIETAKANEMKMNWSEQRSEGLRDNLDSVEVYGFQQFRDKKAKLFTSSTDAKAPKNYVIGVGDEIHIIVYGYTDFNELFIVDKEGYIQPRYTGRIYVKGLTLDAAQIMITKKFNQNYNLSNSKLDISLNYSRVITTHVVGEVENPGSYTFPAINTAYNLLSHIGGPTRIGSLRNIQIKRAGKVVEVFDLYKYLFSPEQLGDIFLENNDYIYVPVASNIVSVDGAVMRPGKYEMLSGETVADLLRYSAGYLPGGFKGSLQIKRYQNDKMVIIDVSRDKYDAFTLERGDIVSIKNIAQEPRNYVRIHGTVYVPGTYEAEEGMRLMDVIDKAQGLLPETFLKEAYILRVNEDFTRSKIKINLGNAIKDRASADNVQILGRDEIIIFSQSQFYDKFGVSIMGGVREPKSYPLLFGMSLRDIIIMSGGLKEDAILEKAVIYRTLPNLEEEAIYVSLDTTNHLASLDSIFLQQKDNVRIFEKTSHQDAHTITVHGAVRNPGVQAFRRNMTLSEALLASGDVKVNAAYNRIEVSRIMNLDSIGGTTPARITVTELQIAGNVASDGQANSFILQPYDEIFVRDIPNFRQQQTIVISGEVNYPGVYALTSKDEKLTSIIQRAGGFTTYAYAKGASMLRMRDPDKGLIVMNLEEAIRRKKSRYNYILRAGDSIHVPVSLDFVTLKGAIEHPDIKKYGAVNVPYAEGRNAKFYINNYGTGFTEKAVKNKTIVSYPNGEARKPNFVLFGRKFPGVDKGSEIYVPERNYLTKVEKKQQRSDKDRTDVASIIQVTVSTLASMLTMALLIITTIKN